MSILTFWVPKDSDPTAIKTVVTDVMKSLPEIDYRIADSADIPMPGVGELVLAMGSDNAASLAKAGIVPKGRSVTSLRGTLFARKVSGLMMPDEAGNLVPAPNGFGHWMVSFAPGLALMEADKQPLMAWDVRLAYRYLTKGTLAPQVGKYAYTEDLSGVIQYVDAVYAKTGRPVRLSTDLETMGLVPWLDDKQIVTISVTPEKGHSDVVITLNATPAKMKLLAEQLEYLLTTEKVITVGANLKYDLIWIRVKFGVVCTNFKFDTLLVGSLINENRSNSLNLHAKVYTQMGGYDDPFNAKHDKARMELALQKDPQEFLTYAGGDTDAAWQVVDEQAKELQAEPSLKLFYARVLHPAARAFENIEYRGLVVDTEAYAELRKELVSHAEEAESKALEMIPGRLKLKHVDKGLTLSRKALISDFLFSPQGLNLNPLMLTAKSGEPKTDKAHLMMFRDHPEAGPFIEAMNEWSSATKIRSTYVDGFLAHLHPDGRFHPTYMLFAGSAFEGKDDDGGTNTGRLSATGPAVQCMVGETLVLTDQGYKRMDWLVDRGGAGCRVLTHAGYWRKIIGTYRNGTQPVFDITSELGHKIRCTGNHPILTAKGWVRADAIKPGDTCYVVGAPIERVRESDVFDVGFDEEPLPESNLEGLGSLRGPRDFGLRTVAELQELLGGYGGATTRKDHRTSGRRRELRAGELCLGNPEATGAQPFKQAADHARGGDIESIGMGDEGGHQQGTSGVAAVQGSDYDRCPDAREAQQCGYTETRIASIVAVGLRETFDLTIDCCHSFVANNMVVHNTIPKHNKWAKKLRKCLPAPPGMVFWQADFSQGELRIAADRANEETMLHAYHQGLDLHAVTGSKLAGFELDEFLALADLPEDSEGGHIYATFRQRAKPANFGLLYGMQAEGFREYARVSTNGKMKLTFDEAYETREAFFALYSKLLPWHSAEVNHAKQKGWVMNPLGRVRHLPLIHSKSYEARSKSERQAINAPIQGCLSDMNIWAASIMEQNWGGEGLDKLWIAGATHDSIYGYCPEHNAKEVWFPRIVEVMSTLPIEKVFGWSAEVSFPADIEAGPTMGDMTKVKLAI